MIFLLSALLQSEQSLTAVMRRNGWRLLLTIIPLIVGVLVAIGVMIWVINREGTILDANLISLNADTEEEAQALLLRLEAGESFADIATSLGEDAPFPVRRTPENSRLPEADIAKVFQKDAVGTLVGPYEARRGWAVSRVESLTIVEPSSVWDLIYEQTLKTAENRAKVVDFWLPVFLCSLGLLLTFTAGLWNIGIEGQVGMGALGATSIALFVDLPYTQQIMLELFVAAAAGAGWALLAAVLRTRGGVNEIFGGVALNFIVSNFSAFLLVGPWKPATSTGSATERFPDNSLLSSLDAYRLSPVTLSIAVAAFIFVFLTLVGSRWGLQLKAMGRNQRSAEVLGIATERNIWLSMAICGALAGIAGAHLVLFRRSNLPANVSGGIGFLALLVVLLASVRVTWVPFISIVFAGLYLSGLPLRTRLELDSSLIGVMVGVLVFVVLIFDGVRMRFLDQWERRQVPTDNAPSPKPDKEVTHGSSVG